MLCISAAYAVVWWLFVVPHVRVLCWNCHSYYGIWIGNRTQTFEWYHYFQWPPTEVTMLFNVKNSKWYRIELYLQCQTSSKSYCGVSNGAISNDLERPLTQLSRSRSYLTLNILETVRDRDIVVHCGSKKNAPTLADYNYDTVQSILIIFSKLFVNDNKRCLVVKFSTSPHICCHYTLWNTMLYFALITLLIARNAPTSDHHITSISVKEF